MARLRTFEKIASLENLLLAWRKVENAMQKEEIWFDELNAFEFKLNLMANLRSIREEILSGTYIMRPIKPAPFPKGPKVEEDGHTTLRVRQAFYVNIRDQVTWMALYIVIGPEFEKKMPAWSYGNRLALTFWKKKGNGKEEEEDAWVHGPFRRTSPYFYMKWTHSWPLYRRRITASIKCLAGIDDNELEEEEQKTIGDNAKEEVDYLRLKYLDKNYFREHGKYNQLYWMGIDFTKFYQDINMHHVAKLLFLHSSGIGELFHSLINSLTSFEVDYSEFSDEELHAMQLDRHERFTGLPTGLIVAGAIANLYMLDIDRHFDEELDRNKEILHFRYVDDHVFVSTDPMKLYQWVNQYIAYVEKNGYVHVNKDKFDPSQIKEVFSNRKLSKEYIVKLIEDSCSLDAHYPSPLMTQSLMKVSQLGKLDMAVLTQSEYNLVMSDLKEMLTTDIPEQEIKKVTRISFACSLLARVSIQSEIDYDKAYQLKRQWYDQVTDLEKHINKQDKELKLLLANLKLVLWDNKHEFQTKVNLAGKININLRPLAELRDLFQKGEKRDRQKRKSVLNLLYKSINELPERNKIWIRAYEYALRYLPEELCQLYAKLDRLSKGKIQPLTYEYLDSMLARKTASNIFLLIRDLESKQDKGGVDKDEKLKRLKILVELREHESNRYYSHASYLMLHQAKRAYNQISTKYELKKISFSEEVIGSFHHYNNCFWILWEIWKANHERLRIEPFVHTFIDTVDSIPPQDAHAPVLFLWLLNTDFKDEHHIFKECFSNSAFRQSLLDIVKKDELVYVMYSKGIKYFSYLDDYFYKKLIRMQRKSARTLSDWIDWVNNHETTGSGLDVLKSEYLSVKLMINIVEAVRDLIRKESTTEDKINIHPTNIVIMNQVEKITWHELLNEKLSYVYIPLNGILSPYYYTYPKTLLADRGNDLFKKRSIVYGLGLIFLQLLSKERVIPWIMNRPEYGFEWNILLSNLLHEGKISSCNYRLIKSCLSPSTLEAIMMNNDVEGYDGNDNRNGTEWVEWNDGPIVRSIDDLLNRLRENEKLLKKNVVSLLDQQYRQIIEIDLK